MMRYVCACVLAFALGLACVSTGAAQTKITEEALLPGQVQMIGKAQVSPNFGGSLTKLLVEHGQAVKKGQIMAFYETSSDTLENIKEQLSDVDLAQAKTRLAEANQLAQNSASRLRSIQELIKKNMSTSAALAKANLDADVSRRAVEYAQTVLSQVQSDMELRRKQITEKTSWESIPAKLTRTLPLRAPEDGNVVWIKPGLSPGESFRDGVPLFQVAPYDPVLIEVNVHEKEAMRAKVGGKAVVEFSAFPDKHFESKVDTLNLAPDQQAGKNSAPAGSTAAMLPFIPANPADTASYYRMTLRLPNPDHSLREGMTATVRLLD